MVKIIITNMTWNKRERKSREVIYLLLENGDYLLQENGDKIVLSYGEGVWNERTRLN